MIDPALNSAVEWGAQTPHPFLPLNVILDTQAEHKRRSQPQWAQVRTRRARILAAARKLLAQEGSERLTVKDLASEVELSVPTIYNLIGTRQDVLIQAMNDHTIAMCKMAKDTAVYPHFVLGLADMYAVLAERYPEFMRAITLAYFSGKAELFNPWHDCGVRLIVESLVDTQKAGLLRSEFNPEKVGRRCSAAISTSLYEWTIGAISNNELRDELLSSTAFSLMRALSLQAAAELEDWLGRREVHPCYQP
jgi:AcrR family transcriptional regulator